MGKKRFKQGSKIYTLNKSTLIKLCHHGTNILDCKSDIGAHVKSNLCYLISLRHLIRSRTVRKSFFFLHSCTKCAEVPAYISTMGCHGVQLISDIPENNLSVCRAKQT